MIIKTLFTLFLIAISIEISAGNWFSSPNFSVHDMLTTDLAELSKSFATLSEKKQTTLKKKLVDHYIATQRAVFNGKMLYFAGGIESFCNWQDGDGNSYRCTLAPDAALSFLITSVINNAPHAWLSDVRNEPYKHFYFSPENLPINCMATLINSGLMLTSACQNPSYNPQVTLWNLTTQEKECTFEGHSNTITSLLFSPDGSAAFSGSVDGQVFRYDLHTQKSSCLIKNNEPITCMAISPDGLNLFTGDTHDMVQVWHTVTGKCNNQIGCNDPNFTDQHKISTITMAPNGHFIFIGSTSGYSVLWYFSTHEALEKYICHEFTSYAGYPITATMSNDSNNILVSYAGASFQMPRCYNLATESSITLFGPEKLVGIEHNFIALKFNADLTAIYGLYDNGYMIKWELTEDQKQVEAALMDYTFDQLLFLLQSDNDPKTVNAKITAGEIYFSILNSLLPQD